MTIRRHWKQLEFVLKIALLKTNTVKNNKHNSIENRERNFFLFVLGAFTLENFNGTIN